MTPRVGIRISGGSSATNAVGSRVELSTHKAAAALTRIRIVPRVRLSVVDHIARVAAGIFDPSQCPG